MTLEKLKSAIFMAGSCIFQFSLETASVGAKGHMVENSAE
jgi:hypothetical protein